MASLHQLALSLLVLVLSCLSIVPSVFAIAPVGVPTVPGSPWSTSSFPTRVMLDSTDLPAIDHSFIGYSPFISSPAVRSTVPLRLRVVLPHGQDVSNFGCGYTQAALEDGSLIAGTALLIPRGLCTFSVKQIQAATRSPALLIIYDSQPSSSIANLPPTFLGDIVTRFAFPAVGINKKDGDKLAAMLAFNKTGNGLNPVVYLTIQPAGYLINWNSTQSPAPADPAASSLLYSALTDFARNPSTLATVNARPWADIANPALDPCFDRVLSLWCENGRIVRLDLGFAGWSGAMTPAIGSLSDLQLLSAPFNSLTSVPASLCNLDKLAYITLNNNPLVSFPDCFDRLPQLIALEFAQCALQSAITTLGPANPLLVWANFNGNSIRGALSPSWATPRLEYLDLSNSRINGGGVIGALPSFKGLQSLYYIDLSNNYFTAPIPDNSGSTAYAFDGLASLTTLNVKNNAIQGPLPTLLGAASLVTLDLSYNNFTGPAGLASYSALSSVQSITLRGNRLSAPINSFGVLPVLASIDLSFNFITNYDPATPFTIVNNWLTFTLVACATSVTSFSLANNYLTGPSFPTLIVGRSGLAKLDVSYNSITSVPTDLFAAKGMTSFDISYNRLDSTAQMPSGSPSNRIIFLSFAGNPNFINPNKAAPLPVWLGLQAKTLISNIGDSFSCKKLIPAGSNTNPSLAIGLDPTYYNYASCGCQSGTFGLPPNCRAIPTTNQQSLAAPIVQPDGVISSSVAFTDPADSIDPTASSSVTQGAIGSGLLTNLKISEIPIEPYSLSDSWYGNQRTLSGIDTVWTADLSSSLIAYDVAFTNRTYTKAAYASAWPAPRYSLEAVRIIHLDIFFNLNEFKYSSDQLDVYQGASDLRGSLIKSFRGSEYIESVNKTQFHSFFHALFASAPARSSLVDPLVTVAGSAFSPSVLASYESVIDAFPSIGYGRVSVLSSQLSVNFQSRSKAGQHFYLIYAGDEQCPKGFEYDALVNSCAPVLPEYAVSSGLVYAVYAGCAFVGLPIIVIAAILYRNRNTALVRAASRPFTAMVLVNLLFMAGSASLYATAPKNNNSLICHARVWSTSLSLMGVLSVLVAKAFRISIIFGSKLLLEIRSVTDLSVAFMVTLFLATQFVMLSAFSALNMSQAVQEIISHAQSDSSSSSAIEALFDSVFTPDISTAYRQQERVWACSTSNGFNTWMGIQIAIFAGVMMAGAFVAFKTRSVPSAFNESTHILMSLEILLLFLIMLVPLDWLLVNSSPEGAVVIQAGGQLVLALFLTAIHFGPKLYYLMSGRGDDRALITTVFTQKDMSMLAQRGNSNPFPDGVDPLQHVNIPRRSSASMGSGFSSGVGSAVGSGSAPYSPNAQGQPQRCQPSAMPALELNGVGVLINNLDENTESDSSSSSGNGNRRGSLPQPPHRAANQV